MSIQKKAVPVVALVAGLVVALGGTCAVGMVVSGYYGLRPNPVEAACQVGGRLPEQCVFTNTQSYSGSRCVQVHVTHTTRQEEIISRPVCSGEVEASDTTTSPVMFINGNVNRLCGLNTGANCTMEVEML